MTAQYYLWYLSILPLTLINNDLRSKNFTKFSFFAILWGFGQAFWGYYANLFENFG